MMIAKFKTWATKALAPKTPAEFRDETLEDAARHAAAHAASARYHAEMRDIYARIADSLRDMKRKERT